MENVEVKEMEKTEVKTKTKLRKAKKDLVKVSFMEGRNVARARNRQPAAYSQEEIDSHK